MAGVGSLFANLTFESANFTKGVDRATAKLQGMQKTFSSVGGKISGIGAKMSIGITAPLAGITAAFIGSARDIAASVKEIERSAALSGATFEGFQKMAFAAKSVGVESDKLTDILKDTTERFGEFAATGGGELKDFFTNVAPKVGLTADAFKKLSGPEALQAYYNALSQAGLSQQQMTFYMEALASDATELIPLLAQNGKLMGEMGEKAAIISPDDAKRLKEYNNANLEMEQAFQKLTIAVVKSGLLEKLTKLVEKVAEWAGNLSKSNPELVKWSVGIAGLAAALGPTLIGLGSMVGVVGKLLPLLRFIPGPVGLIAAAVGAAWLVWKNWDKIGPIIQSLYNGVKNWLGDKMGKILDWVGGKVRALVEPFKYLWDKVVGHSWVPDLVDGIQAEFARLDAVMVKPVTDATSKAEEAFRAMQERVAGIMDGLFPATKAYREELEKLAALEADKSLNPDVRTAAIIRQTQKLAEARAAMDAENFPTLDRPDSTIPGELQPLPGVPMPIDRLERIQGLAASLGETFGRMGTKTGDAFATIADAIGRDIIPALQQTQQQAMNTGNAIMQMGQGITSIFQSIFGRKTGGIIGGIVNLGLTAFKAFGGFSGSGTPGFANGGSIRVGGNPGIDRNLLSINGLPAARVSAGEIVTVNPANDMGARGGNTVIINAQDAVLTSTVRQWVAEGMEIAANKGASMGSTGAQIAIHRKQAKAFP
ncbi:MULTISPECIES: hypothetical protein [unclassified Sphingobium]|uniref:hypothetical protein n=1 Tax=unclassified Sphingobium TaxID=2611147 RepID=UPI0035A6AEE1